jgi:hypothetical protein
MTSWLGKYFKRKIDRYEILGFLFMAFGAVFSEYSFVYRSNVSLTAVGISSLILGIVTAVGSGVTKSRNLSFSIVKESYSNIEEILRQFDASETGIYLPPRGGKVFAYTPLSKKSEPEYISKALTTPIHTLMEVDGEPGLVVFMPVPYDNLTLIKNKKKVGQALKSILVDQMKMLDSLKAREYEDKIVVRMTGSKIESQYPITEKIFGSIPSSISGCIISYYLNKPLVFINESKSRNVTTVRFEVPRKK